MDSARFPTDQAAIYLGTARKTLDNWRSLSRKRKTLVGPAWISLGGKIVYDQRTLDAYLLAQTFQPPKRRGRPRSSGDRK
jgi:hypothetical protein